MSIKKDLKYNIVATTGLVGSMWLVHVIDYLWVFDKVNSNGIVPRTFDGLDGILWSPFASSLLVLCQDMSHLLCHACMLCSR